MEKEAWVDENEKRVAEKRKSTAMRYIGKHGKEMVKRFAEFDTDGNGVLDHEELAYAIKTLGELDTFGIDEPGGQVRGGFEAELVRILILELDRDGDGSIDQHELAIYLRRVKPDGSVPDGGGCACSVM